MLRRVPFRIQRLRQYSTTIEKWVNNVVTEEVNLSNGTLELKTGHMARFASGVATASTGNSTILATVVTTEPKEDSPTTSLPGVISLGVDFLQSASAIGRIPMNYLRRELQQSDMDILISRMIDRSIRPLIPPLYGSPIKVVCKPLSLDRNVDIRVLGINAASTAMALSSIPLLSNVAACRVAMINNEASISTIHLSRIEPTQRTVRRKFNRFVTEWNVRQKNCND
ncbi:Polyribonucleotide nucleotidyltransferase 1, mitochondrial [Aphelenchoides bicaudatus]|nr:Polyribonucleotide nucleotidyltransferase 1, mitochondrial [Aphelenchoides bicaudatus]